MQISGLKPYQDKSLKKTGSKRLISFPPGRETNFQFVVEIIFDPFFKNNVTESGRQVNFIIQVQFHLFVVYSFCV